MYQVEQSPEEYRRWEAQARQAAAEALSHNTRQIQLELADSYKSLAERAQGAQPSPTGGTRATRLSDCTS